MTAGSNQASEVPRRRRAISYAFRFTHVVMLAGTAALVLSGCGVGSSSPRVLAARPAVGSIVFGSGLDRSTGSVTGAASSFSVGDTIYWAADLSGPSGADVRLTVVKDEGATEEVVASSDMATPSPDGTNLFSQFNTAAGNLVAGDYTMKLLHHDRLLAQGNFSLTFTPPDLNAAGSADTPTPQQSGDVPGVVAAVNSYQHLLDDVYGPQHSVSMLNEAAVGRAARAIWCIVQGKQNSLVNTHSFLTYAGTSDQFHPVQFNGDTALVPVHIQQRINTHSADGTVSGYDADYTITFTLTNIGDAWKVTNYSWVGADGSTGGASEDAQPCQ